MAVSDLTQRVLDMKVGGELHMFVANDDSFIIDPETVSE